MNEPAQLPGATTIVRAERVLVLAPHYDDEVLGCGGLLCQLVAQGARVRVLFLSDGSGGVEQVGDRHAYAARRRAESRRVAERLGVTSIRELELLDGALMDHVAEIGDALGEELEAWRPDLLLAPSPREISSDHRAVFLGLQRALWPLREGEPRHEIAAVMRVLLYEVNRPLDPDLLVDVSAELPEIESLMELYSSQLEMHGYREAAIGLRRYRTLSLPAGVEGAEAYRSLRLQDIVTRSGRDLLARLGGAGEAVDVPDGPLVSVVVRTRDRPRKLREALASIAAGTYRQVEVVVIDDGIDAATVPTDFPFPVCLRVLEGASGPAAAAQLGLETAAGRYVNFLDDDDLFYPEHLERLVAAALRTDCPVLYGDAAVVIYERSGEGDWVAVDRRLPYSRDFAPELLLLDNYIPFHTLLFDRELACRVGAFDASLPCLEDWDLLIRLSAATDFVHVRGVTCEYRHFRGDPSHLFGSNPDPALLQGTRTRIYRKYADRLDAGTLATGVALLREDAVRLAESVRSLRGELVRHREVDPEG